MYTYPTHLHLHFIGHLSQRLGRKRLMQISVGGALISHLAVGYGLNEGMVILPSIAITVFVM